MAARTKQDSKQNRRKKAAPAQKSAPLPAQAEENTQTPASQESQASPLKKTALTRGQQTPMAHAGTVRRSLLYLTAVLCLLLGIYLGTLLPAFYGPKNLPSPVQQNPVQPQPSQTGQGMESSGSKALEEAVRKDPQDLHAWIQLGNSYFDANKPREAIRAYEHALSIKGDDPDVLTDVGIMYRQLGEFERAAEKFTQASAIDPRHEQSRFNLGVVLFFDLNRKDEARKVWRALVGINPRAKTPDGALLSVMLDELK